MNNCINKTSHVFVVADLRRNRSREATARSYCDETTTKSVKSTLVGDFA